MKNTLKICVILLAVSIVLLCLGMLLEESESFSNIVAEEKVTNKIVVDLLISFGMCFSAVFVILIVSISIIELFIKKYAKEIPKGTELKVKNI